MECYAEHPAHIIDYTGSSKNPETLKYIENEAFFRKMFQTKVIGFKKIYLLIASV